MKVDLVKIEEELESTRTTLAWTQEDLFKLWKEHRQLGIEHRETWESMREVRAASGEMEDYMNQTVVPLLQERVEPFMREHYEHSVYLRRRLDEMERFHHSLLRNTSRRPMRDRGEGSDAPLIAAVTRRRLFGTSPTPGPVAMYVLKDSNMLTISGSAHVQVDMVIEG